MSSEDSSKDSEEPARASRSICEDALEGFRVAEDTFAGLIESNHIEVRDFMILSFVCDQGAMSIDRIKSALGLSTEMTMHCLSRLLTVELVQFNIDVEAGLTSGVVYPTGLGQSVARRIHDAVPA